MHRDIATHACIVKHACACVPSTFLKNSRLADIRSESRTHCIRNNGLRKVSPVLGPLPIAACRKQKKASIRQTVLRLRRRINETITVMASSHGKYGVWAHHAKNTVDVLLVPHERQAFTTKIFTGRVQVS